MSGSGNLSDQFPNQFRRTCPGANHAGNLVLKFFIDPKLTHF